MVWTSSAKHVIHPVDGGRARNRQILRAGPAARRTELTDAGRTRHGAAKWTQNDWRIFYQRTFQEAEGGPAEKHGAAYSQSMALWLSFNQPPQHLGLCVQCNKPLDIPLSSISGAPIRIDGAWVHWGCMPWFCRARWDSAKDALWRFGITGSVL
jgi:hypothetical protein